MIEVIKRCKDCNGLKRKVILTDKSEDSYAQFLIHYCPNCLKLDDEKVVTCWATTIKKKEIEG